MIKAVRKLLAFAVVCVLMLTLAPSVARATVERVYVGGTSVSIVASDEDKLNSDGWAWTASTNTLTLNATYTDERSHPIAIECDLTDSITINVIGNVEVIGNATRRTAIECYGNLTITGGGTLTATGNDGTYGGNGILVGGELTIEAKTNAYGGDSTSSNGGSGISVDGDLTIEAETNAYGGDGNAGGIGLYAVGDLAIKAETNAIGGDGNGFSGGAGIGVNGDLTIGAETIAVGGTGGSSGGVGIFFGNSSSDINFIVPSAALNAMLNVSTPTSIAGHPINMAVNAAAPLLRVGDEIALIDSVSGNPTPDTLTVSGYTFELSVDNNVLIAKVTAVPPAPVPPPQADEPPEPYVPAPYIPAPVISGFSVAPSDGGAMLSVSALADGLPIDYQWFYLDPATGLWVAIPGANTPSFSYFGLAEGQHTVRARVGTMGSYAFSQTAVFTVEPSEAAAEPQPEPPFPASATVAGRNVNVRPDSNTRGKALAKLQNGDEIVIVGYENGFFKIEWDGGYAYISADYVEAMFGAPLSGEVSGKVYAQTRESASSRYRAKTLNKGDSVELIGRFKTWWLAEIDGETVYIKNGKNIAV